MNIQANTIQILKPLLNAHPVLKAKLVEADRHLGLLLHSAAGRFPFLIRPSARRLTVAITSFCNLRCLGCCYGRGFMTGHQLSLETMRELLQDAKEAGISLVRLYGGEPLLHPDLAAIVRCATELELNVYITTNGILLKQKIDELYAAGLRNITIGFYGTGAEYEKYVQVPDRFRYLEEGLETVRARYGNAISIQMNFLIMRPSCNVDAVQAAWQFAKRYDMSFRTDLIHYSLPYFMEGLDNKLQFTEEDRPAMEEVVRALAAHKQEDPARFTESMMSIQSIPDWLLKGPSMRVPCDAYHLIWVGADGTVQLCYVTFKLGNLHEHRLRDLLFTRAHREAARNAFLLRCPNCHCERDSRIQKHSASRKIYG